MPQLGGREGGALQYGGRTTYLCQGDILSFWSFWSVMHLILTKSSSTYKKLYKTFSWWKGGKALRTCKTPRILRAYRMVSKPTQDWKTVGKSSWWWGGQKIFLLFGKRRPSTEVKQWMLRSMCDDCPHKIFTHHVTNRSHNIWRKMIPTAVLSRCSHLLNQIPDNGYLSFSYDFNFEWAFFSPE